MDIGKEGVMDMDGPAWHVLKRGEGPGFFFKRALYRVWGERKYTLEASDNEAIHLTGKQFKHLHLIWSEE
jgi:hypothetical protein